MKLLSWLGIGLGVLAMACLPITVQATPYVSTVVSEEDMLDARELPQLGTQDSSWISDMESIFATRSSEGTVSLLLSLEDVYRLEQLATFLLVWNPEITLVDGSGGEAGLSPLWTVWLGEPLQTPKTLASLRDGVAQVYVRSFAHGLVAVNPSLQERVLAVNGVQLRLSVMEGDTGTELLWLNVADSVTIAPGSAVILRRPNAPAYVGETGTEEVVEEEGEETAQVVEEVEEVEEVESAEEEHLIEETNIEVETTVSAESALEALRSLALPAVNLDQLFTDVAETLRNAMAIEYLYRHKIVQGYSDGSYKPYQTINRAELLKILLEGNQVEVTTPRVACFIDVPLTEWYASYVCTAKAKGWVQGYPDGTYQPGRTVNKVEALKILGAVYGWNVAAEAPGELGFSDVDPQAWYGPYLRFARNRNLLEEEGTVYGPTFGMNRGKVAEYVFRWLVVREQGIEAYSIEAGAMALEQQD